MLERILPDAKGRLMMFEPVTSSLKRSGDLCDIPLTAIESDDRWTIKRKSFLTHSFDDSRPSDAIKRKDGRQGDVTKRKDGRQGDAAKRKDGPTVGEKKRVAKKKRLGMLRMGGDSK